MAKFHGMIGFTQQVETKPGVWTNQVTEREYYGDVIRQSKQWTNSGYVNDNLDINNRISIVADDFASANFSVMVYVILGGVYWKISTIEIQRPRLVLSLSGVYNGNKA